MGFGDWVKHRIIATNLRHLWEERAQGGTIMEGDKQINTDPETTVGEARARISRAEYVAYASEHSVSIKGSGPLLSR